MDHDASGQLAAIEGSKRTMTGDEGAQRGGRRLKVLIVEDHRTVAEGLAALLGSASDLEVVSVVDDIGGPTPAPAIPAPDVILLDYWLPRTTGAEVAVELRQLWPSAAIVFLSAVESEDALLAAVEAGASGYLLKTGPASELLSAVRRAALGEMLIPPEKLARLLQWQRERARERAERDRHEREQARLLEQLTHRERAVLRLIVAGADNKTIARQLTIGQGTARTHVQRVLEKLGVHSKLEAAALAVERGLVVSSGR